MTDFLYRYEDVHYSRGVDDYDNPIIGGHVCVELRRYPITKRTPKGAWIKECWAWSATIPFPGEESRRDKGEKFVLLTAHKRFAAETQEQALDDYRYRKRRQIKILKSQILSAEAALFAADRPDKETYY